MKDDFVCFQGNFECLQCGKHFMTPSGLANHETTHSEDQQPVHCETCGVGFVSIYGLQRHVKRGACKKNMGKKKYTELKVVEGLQDCTNCSTTFDDFEALRDHILTSGCIDQMENPPDYFRDGHHFFCFKCSVSFENFVQFREHDEMKGCEKVLKDDLTGDAVILTQGSFTEYQKTGSKFVCTSCTASFVSLQSLKRHKKRGACEKNLQNMALCLKRCDTCQEDFPSSEELQKHKEHCSDRANVDGVSCHDCGMYFKNSHALNRHKSEIHSQDSKASSEVKHLKPFACRDCGSCFSTAGSVKRHKLRGACDKLLGVAPKRSDSERRIFCNDCGKGFTAKDSLQKHVKRGACEKMQKKMKTCAASPKDV